MSTPEPLTPIGAVWWTPPTEWRTTSDVWVDPQPGDWMRYRPRVCQWPHVAAVLEPTTPGTVRLMIREGSSPVVSTVEVPAGEWLYYQHTVHQEDSHRRARP